jgi:hypothetical protein
MHADAGAGTQARHCEGTLAGPSDAVWPSCSIHAGRRMPVDFAAPMVQTALVVKIAYLWMIPHDYWLRVGILGPLCILAI